MKDLALIKKYYGEDMMRLCRTLFPTILEKEGLLFSILDRNFAHSKFLYEDIINDGKEDEFKNFIYSFVDVEKKEASVLKTPFELMDEAGYILYECKTEEEIQSFRKYYEQHEELCTFYGNRLARCHVFFAIKKNVDEIRREDFLIPNRQDLYGTSVISIQFARGDTNTLSIKNRYNHSVNNPDATFSNDLENIIPGLTESFEKYYGYNINSNKNSFEMPHYIKANNGKYYKYNCEKNNIYYCPDNIIIDNFEVIDEYAKEKERYIVIDYFILDLKEKTIKSYYPYLTSSFDEAFDNIEKINIEKSENGEKKISVITDKGESTWIINKNNTFKKVDIPYVQYVNSCFLDGCSDLEVLSLENLLEAGDDFVSSCWNLQKINAPKLEKVGDRFAYNSCILRELSLENLLEVGDDFAGFSSLQKINAPKLEKVGNDFAYSSDLKALSLENLLEVGDDFASGNGNLQEIKTPKLEKVGSRFAIACGMLKKLSLESLLEAGDDFAGGSHAREIKVPKLEKVGSRFINNCYTLKDLTLENLIESGDDFLCDCWNLQKISVPKLAKVGNGFIAKCRCLKGISLESLLEAGNDFARDCYYLQELKAPRLEKTGNRFAIDCPGLEELSLENLLEAGDDFAKRCYGLQELKVPRLEKVGDDFATDCDLLEDLNLVRLNNGRDDLDDVKNNSHRR